MNSSPAEYLYRKDSPVILLKPTLIWNPNTQKQQVCVTVKNLTCEPLIQVDVHLVVPLSKKHSKEKMDLELDFTSPTPVFPKDSLSLHTNFPFPAEALQSLSIIITSVTYADGRKLTFSPLPHTPISSKRLWLCSCGAVNLAGGDQCFFCGQQKSDSPEPAAPPKRSVKPKRHFSRKHLLVALFLLGILGICFWLYSDYLRANTQAYNTAISLVEQGKYEEARVKFQTLGNFEDSAQWLEEIQNRQEKDLLEQGKALLEQGDFQQARSYLDQLPQDYEGKEQLLLEATVIEARQTAEQGKAPEAYKLLQALPADYEPTAELLQDFQYVVVRTGSPGGSFQTEYTYNRRGDLESLQYTDSTTRETTTHTYDDEGRLIRRDTVTDPRPEFETPSITEEFLYSGDRLTQKKFYEDDVLQWTVDYITQDGIYHHAVFTYPDGDTLPMEFTYDEGGNLILLQTVANGAPVSTMERVFDHNGRVTTERLNTPRNPQATIAYVYDSQGALIERDISSTDRFTGEFFTQAILYHYDYIYTPDFQEKAEIDSFFLDF